MGAGDAEPERGRPDAEDRQHGEADRLDGRKADQPVERVDGRGHGVADQAAKSGRQRPDRRRRGAGERAGQQQHTRRRRPPRASAAWRGWRAASARRRGRCRASKGGRRRSTPPAPALACRGRRPSHRRRPAGCRARRPRKHRGWDRRRASWPATAPALRPRRRSSRRGSARSPRGPTRHAAIGTPTQRPSCAPPPACRPRHDLRRASRRLQGLRPVYLAPAGSSGSGDLEHGYFRNLASLH